MRSTWTPATPRKKRQEISAATEAWTFLVAGLFAGTAGGFGTYGVWFALTGEWPVYGPGSAFLVAALLGASFACWWHAKRLRENS